MENNAFQQVLSLLVEIKLTIQKGGNLITSDLLNKIDRCITKVAPLADVYNINSSTSIESNSIDHAKSKSVIVKKSSDKLSERLSYNNEANTQVRKSANDELIKVCNSFIRKQSKLQIQCRQIQSERSNVLLDYFVIRYNLQLNEYVVVGKKGSGRTDRKVFLDLLTFENKKDHVSKLERTQSMTAILKEIFSQYKPSQPFILPNYQEDRAKYLFAFGLRECGAISQQYFQTETFCCFVSHQFILGELTQLMAQISKLCFQQQVSEASSTRDGCLAQTISYLHCKKTSQRMENIIEEYLQNRDTNSRSNILTNKPKQIYLNTIEEYLQRSSVRWSLIKKQKEQKLIMTLILLYYLALSEYKILMISTSENKYIISELFIGLTRALSPLTYIYPVVGATITQHHFQFANSPVPILVGFWGSKKDYLDVKTVLKKAIKLQKNMKSEELEKQTLLAVVDLQDHSFSFLDSAYKEVSYVCQKIQSHIQLQTNQGTSVKLAHLTRFLIENQPKQEWMRMLVKKIKGTQMYDYFTSKK